MIRHISSLYNKISINILVITLFSICILSGCNKKLDVTSTHLTQEESGWTSYEDVQSAIMGIYGLLRTAMADQNSYWMFGDLRNGDFTSFSRSDLQSIIDGRLNESNDLMNELLNWRRFYAVIDACNLFIENSSQALIDDRYTELNNDVDIAQARAVRAYVYYYICQIWGDVPLITSSQNGTFEDVAKTSQDKVLSFATSELLSVINQLPYEYGSPNDPIYPGNYYGYDNTKYYNTLFNKVFGYAVLAHIAAWQGKYNDAEAYCQNAMDDASLIGASLITDITQLTDANGFFYDKIDTRQFFSINASVGNNESGITGTGHIESLTLAQPLVSKQYPQIYISKDSLSNIFTDVNDTRFGIDSTTGLYTTNYITNFGGDIPLFTKIKVVGDGGTTTTNLSIFSSSIVLDRLEEIYLLDAESLAVLNQTSDAISQLNIIKANRGETLYSGEGGAPLIQEIFQERRRELMGEGWRWFDIVRYNKIVRNNPDFNELIDNGGIYWPIAKSVLSSVITQNTYWK